MGGGWVNAVEEVKGPTVTLFHTSAKSHNVRSSLPPSLPSGSRRGTFPEPSVPHSLLDPHPSPHTYCSCSTRCVTSKLTRRREEKREKVE